MCRSSWKGSRARSLPFSTRVEQGGVALIALVAGLLTSGLFSWSEAVSRDVALCLEYYGSIGGDLIQRTII